MEKIKVLIDDDILIQLGKQLEAEKLGYQLDCYFNIDEFMANHYQYHLDTPIYLGNALPPISLDGFQNIYSITELVIG